MCKVLVQFGQKHHRNEGTVSEGIPKVSLQLYLCSLVNIGNSGLVNFRIVQGSVLKCPWGLRENDTTTL